MISYDLKRVRKENVYWIGSSIYSSVTLVRIVGFWYCLSGTTRYFPNVQENKVITGL
jgi:hypothetical protein